jgi:hypothetical protein
MFSNYFATTEHVSRLLRDHRTRLLLFNEQRTLVYSFLRDHSTRFWLVLWLKNMFTTFKRQQGEFIVWESIHWRVLMVRVPCSVMYSVQCDVFRAVLCVPCSMMCSVQYYVFRVVWCVPCRIMCSVQYDVFRVVWCIPCSMMRSVQYNVFRAVWCVPCSIMCSVQYYVFRAVWCVPCSIMCSVQYDVFLIMKATFFTTKVYVTIQYPLPPKHVLDGKASATGW